MPTPEELEALKKAEEEAAAAKAAEEAAAADMIPASRLTGLIKEGKKKDEALAALQKRLDAIEADKLSDIEKAKRDAERAGEESAATKETNAKLTKQLRQALVATHFKDAHDPQVAAGFAPDDMIEIEDGKLTAACKKNLNGLKKSHAWAFDDGKKPGNTPGPGNNKPTPDAAQRYADAVAKGDTEAAKAAFAEMNKTS